MKFPKNRMKIQKLKLKTEKTQFENGKTQFTGDLLAWTGRAMRSKKSPAIRPFVIFKDVANYWSPGQI